MLLLHTRLGVRTPNTQPSSQDTALSAPASQYVWCVVPEDNGDFSTCLTFLSNFFLLLVWERL